MCERSRNLRWIGSIPMSAGRSAVLEAARKDDHIVLVLF